MHSDIENGMLISFLPAPIAHRLRQRSLKSRRVVPFVSGHLVILILSPFNLPAVALSRHCKYQALIDALFDILSVGIWWTVETMNSPQSLKVRPQGRHLLNRRKEVEKRHSLTKRTFISPARAFMIMLPWSSVVICAHMPRMTV